MILDGISAALLLVGCALCLIAGVGLHRFPDVFARMHVATKPATLGVALVVAGTGIRLANAGDVAKLALVLGLQLVTGPTAAHVLGRAAYRAGNELSSATVLDELGSRPAPDAGPDESSTRFTEGP